MRFRPGASFLTISNQLSLLISGRPSFFRTITLDLAAAWRSRRRFTFFIYLHRKQDDALYKCWELNTHLTRVDD